MARRAPPSAATRPLRPPSRGGKSRRSSSSSGAAPPVGSARPVGPVDLYLGSPAYVDVLFAELEAEGLNRARAAEVAAGVVAVPAGRIVDPSFARQVMPSAAFVDGGTVDDLAAAVLAEALERGAVLSPDSRDGVDRVDGDDVMNVVAPELPRRGSRALEESPLASACQQLTDVLTKKRIGRAEKRRARGEPDEAPTGHRVHVLLVSAWSAWVSILRPPTAEAPPLLAWPSPFAGGRALDETAADAPSSAHRKLEEALAWIGAAPGPDDLVLDLGAAPGGWSWLALTRGARVIAVDRADLAPDVAAHPALTHVRADAFRYVPPRQPTWLLCDVIAEPERALELVRRTTASRVLDGLVVTLKLKRPVDVTVLKKARALARATGGFFGRVKHLAGNKLEVTMMLRRAR